MARYSKYENYNGPPGTQCKCRRVNTPKRKNVMSGKYKGRSKGPTGRPRGRPRKYSGPVIPKKGKARQRYLNDQNLQNNLQNMFETIRG